MQIILLCKEVLFEIKAYNLPTQKKRLVKKFQIPNNLLTQKNNLFVIGVSHDPHDGIRTLRDAAPHDHTWCSRDPRLNRTDPSMRAGAQQERGLGVQERLGVLSPATGRSVCDVFSVSDVKRHVRKSINSVSRIRKSKFSVTLVLYKGDTFLEPRLFEVRF